MREVSYIHHPEPAEAGMDINTPVKTGYDT
jgi:hypothetical protein